ncbi:MAG: EamA family transporter, partial [Ktedonobacterales bacterium]|nr:EamA family transporter [Ktedonobacterales bacterium]
LVVALVAGEPSQVHLSSVSPRSALALAYLIIFGSLVAFSAYVWLLRNVAPARVSTYAYVNPAVAVFLGWALASEPLTNQTLLAATVIVGAVALVMVANSRGTASPGAAAPDATGAEAELASAAPAVAVGPAVESRHEASVQ